MTTSYEVEVKDAILSLIEKRGSVSETDLIVELTGYTPDTIRSAMAQLVKLGRVAEYADHRYYVTAYRIPPRMCRAAKVSR